MKKRKQLVGEAWPAESPYQAAGACLGGGDAFSAAIN